MKSNLTVPALQRNLKLSWSLIAATTLGNILEFFDFLVYSFFAALIGKLFFPTLSPHLQLLISVATFGVGSVVRPLGGVIIGSYSDRAGRKKAMALTILLMATGSAMITVTPTYEQIGIAAPMIMVLARLLQGFSAGGELGASTTILIEQSSNQHRGFFGSFQFASQAVGVVMGASAAQLLTYFLSPASLEQWGWRMPFLVGVLIGPLGFYIRNRIEELPSSASQGTSALNKSFPGLHAPLAIVIREQWKVACLGTLLTMGSAVLAYMITLYMPTYAIRELHLSPKAGLDAAIASGLTLAVSALVAGALSDIFGRKKIIALSRLIIVVAIYPCFYWLSDSPSPGRLMAVVIGLGIFQAGSIAPGITMLPEMFPKSVRATGMSIVYGLGVSVFGGFAQFIAVWLVGVTGNKLAPALYMIVCTGISSLALLGIRDRTGEELR